MTTFHGFPVTTFSESTHTSVEAAAALDCQLGQIAKSIVFRAANGSPVLVIASGPNRVDDTKLAALLGQSVAKADADFVKSATGFVIGGVPPFGFATPVSTFIDQDLLAFPQIWAAAGDPHSVFSLTPQELQQLSTAHVAAIKVTA